jgi:transposase-like protein
MQYSSERKEAVLRKMVPPHNRSIKQLAREGGISEATLFNWRSKAREKGLLLPDSTSSPEDWSSPDKSAAVVETAALNEIELAEYCRKKRHIPRADCPMAPGLRKRKQLGQGQKAAVSPGIVGRRLTGQEYLKI